MGEVYTYRKHTGGWLFTQRLTGSSRQKIFGWTLDSTNESIAVGDPWWGVGDRFTAIGQVQIFECVGERWFTEQLLRMPRLDDAGENPMFGYSVALTEECLVVGAPTAKIRDTSGAQHDFAGAVILYERDLDGWNYVRAFRMPLLRSFISGKIRGLGRSVAVRDANTIFAGAPGSNGAVFIYTRTVNGWRRSAIVENPAPLTSDDLFGQSLAVDGNTLVVGSPRVGYYNSQAQTGRAYVFEEDMNGQWQLVSELSASNGTVGKSGGNHFGESVAVHGDTIVVGAPNTLENDEWVGAVYSFYRDSNGWSSTESAEYRASDRDHQWNHGHSYRFGASVGTDGSFIIAGAPHAPTRNKPIGKSYILTRPIGAAFDCQGRTAPARARLLGSARISAGELQVAASGLEGGHVAIVLVSNSYRHVPFGSHSTCLEIPRILLHASVVGDGGLLVHRMDFTNPRLINLLSPGGALYVQVSERTGEPREPAHLTNVVELILE